MKLKSIEEHEEECRHSYNKCDNTGVACPNCGQELVVSGRGITLSTRPHQDVKCFGCNYSTRISIKRDQ